MHSHMHLKCLKFSAALTKQNNHVHNGSTHPKLQKKTFKALKMVIDILENKLSIFLYCFMGYIAFILVVKESNLGDL